MTRRSILLALLPGCAFFFPPDPPPEPVTSIRCGQTVDYEGRPTGDVLDVEVDPSQSIVFLPQIGPEGSSILLDLPDADRALPFWNVEEGRIELPWVVGNGDEPELVLYVPDGGTATGQVELQCSQPPELCQDVADDDQDGRADCYDADCASEPACIEDQQPRLEVDLACTVWSGPLPRASSLDDQVLFYRDRGEVVPDRSWWGGAEILVNVPSVGATLDSEDGGSACRGELNGTVVNCEEVRTITPGSPLTLGEGTWFLEPLSIEWTSMTLTPGCDE
jgi:hypothetical protein